MKKILLITTGGTVSQTKKGDCFDIDHSKNSSKLLENILHKKSDLNVGVLDTSDIFQIDSSNMSVSHWKRMIEEVVDNYEKYDGFVITHGTDTLSYTCAALSYALGNLAKPLVLTGAQVPYGAIGSDAVTNLENAIRVAAQDDVALKGVMCVFGSQVIAGTRVKKVTEFSYDAFETYHNESLGEIGAKLAFHNENVWEYSAKYGDAKTKAELDVKADFSMDKVFVFNEFPGINKDTIRALVELGMKGLVMRAYAGGNTNVGEEGAPFENLRDVYAYIRQQEIPFVIISQPHRGVSTMNAYKPGKMAMELGGIPAYDMASEALTVKLGWLIGQGLSYEKMREMLLTDIRGEVTITT